MPCLASHPPRGDPRPYRRWRAVVEYSFPPPAAFRPGTLKMAITTVRWELAMRKNIPSSRTGAET